MTDGQKQSLHLIYVNVCNAFMYAENLLLEETLSKVVKDPVRVIKNKLEWIKTAIELKTNSSILRKTDTMRYDEILRVVSMLPDEVQDDLEKVIVAFVNARMDEYDNNKKQ